MTLPGQRELVLVENHNPIIASKLPWFENPALRDKGVNLQDRPAGPKVENALGKGWGAIN